MELKNDILSLSANKEGKMAISKFGVMDRHCSEIDALLLSPNTIDEGVITPFSGVAPPQSNPLLNYATGLKNLLKGSTDLYR